MNMIIVRLLGGLGNQLFQYAAGRSVSVRTGLPLKLDVTAFQDYRLRNYCLRHFAILEDFASPEDIARLRGGRLRRMIKAFRCAHPRTYVSERHFHYDPAIATLDSSVYLDGYWQCERYFADIADTIRKEALVTSTISEANGVVQDRIRESNSVAIHVRRGDYANNPKTRAAHGLCALDYYRHAVASMVARVQAPQFFVFSDDSEWVRRNLAIDGAVTFVDHNGPERPHEDLRLMAQCKHHVIANSTFSWWGAWLGTWSGQIVFAPKQWFATHNARARDVCPSHWERL